MHCKEKQALALDDQALIAIKIVVNWCMRHWHCHPLAVPPRCGPWRVTGCVRSNGTPRSRSAASVVGVLPGDMQQVLDFFAVVHAVVCVPALDHPHDARDHDAKDGDGTKG